jgi:hypothetical protein
MTSFIEFYKRHENEKWDYYHLSGNPQVSLLNLEELKYINYASLSKNPNITMEYVINEIKKWDNTTDWCYQNLSSNSSITIEDVKNYKLPWNYYSLSKNPNITIDIIENNPSIMWNAFGFSSNINMDIETYKYCVKNGEKIFLRKSFIKEISISMLSTNQSITYHDVLNYPGEEWSVVGLSQNPSISLYDILYYLSKNPCTQKNIDKCIDNLSENPSVKWSDIEEHPYLNWNLEKISSNPNITWDIIQSNPQIGWNRCGLSMNPNITWDIVEQYPNGPFHDATYNTQYWDYKLLSLNKMQYYDWDLRHLSNKHPYVLK